MVHRISSLRHKHSSERLISLAQMSHSAVAKTVMSMSTKDKVAHLRKSFRSRRTKALEWRRAQLQGLLNMVTEEDAKLKQAMLEDLGKAEFECSLEITDFTGEIKDALHNVSKWMKPTGVSVPILHQPCQASISPEPLGVVLVIGAWNYPISVTLGPLIGALAAGNCVVLKPSEISPSCASLFAELIPKYLDNDCVQVVEGGPKETTELLEQKFDHIMFTGSERIGKIIYAAAAKHLTPVVLELGGKSPVIVDSSANVELTARRLLWGKTFNCGQTCIAPDYVLVMKDVEEQFYAALQKTYKEFFPNGGDKIEDYPRIVNEMHTKRLLSLYNEDSSVRGEIVVGGHVNENEKYISPTVFKNCHPDARIMKEEIFGPLLPCLTVQDYDEALGFILDRPKPLSLYVFSTDKNAIERVKEETSSGSMVVNDVLCQYNVSTLPFGGVGASGFGAYKGHHSFATFSHKKSVLWKSANNMIDFSLRYPPYTENKKYLFLKLL